MIVNSGEEHDPILTISLKDIKFLVDQFEEKDFSESNIHNLEEIKYKCFYGLVGTLKTKMRQESWSANRLSINMNYSIKSRLILDNDSIHLCKVCYAPLNDSMG